MNVKVTPYESADFFRIVPYASAIEVITPYASAKSASKTHPIGRHIYVNFIMEVPPPGPGVTIVDAVRTPFRAGVNGSEVIRNKSDHYLCS